MKKDMGLGLEIDGKLNCGQEWGRGGGAYYPGCRKQIPSFYEIPTFTILYLS